ncbi:hypothetical protein BT69DRAFT_1290763, partial [Atractiella rhizophila]
MLGSPSSSSVSSIPSPRLTCSAAVGANTANSSASSRPDLPYRFNLAKLQQSPSAEIADLVNGAKGNRINNPQIGHARHLTGNIGICGETALGSGENEETGQKSGLLGDVLDPSVERSMHDATLLSPNFILNPCEQVYLWSSRRCVIYPVSILRAWHSAGNDVSHFDTPLIFPEGSYVQSVGGRTYDPDDTTNNFVGFQRCVAECRFQFNNKSPSEIRAAFCVVRKTQQDACRSIGRFVRAPTWSQEEPTS